MGKRYVARLVVEAVTEHEGTGRGDERKHKHAIANIVVGASDLEALKDKASAHLALVEDGGSIEDRTTRG